MHRSLLRTALRALMALTLAAALPACAGGKKDSSAPATKGMTEEEIAAQRAAAEKEGKVAGLIDLANADLAKGRFVSALRRADEALEANPNNADAYAIQGAAYWRAGDFAKSTAAYEKALELDATNFGAIAGLGRNLQASGDHTRAIELQDRLISTESAGWKEEACQDGGCEIGYCDSATNMCKAPMQVGPRLVKLWSQYLLLDMDEAEETIDQIFLGVGADEGSLNLVRAYAEFVRPLVGKGPFIEIEGETGSADLQLDTNLGIKHVSTVIGGEYARSLLFELQDECRISPELVETLGLQKIATFKPVGAQEEQDLVIVPEVEIKGVKVKNVPALVQDLSLYEEAVGEIPGMILGRQFMHRFGTITFDFPGGVVTLSKAGAVPSEASSLPLLMIDLHVLHVPAIPVSIDGSEHQFWAWMGGIYKAGVTVTGKAYLKSQHRPTDIDPPDDEAQGLKMVYVEQVKLGDFESPGAGALVLTKTPPDQALRDVVEATAFELGGYVNLALMKNWKLTYALPQGKVFIQGPKG